MHSDADHRAARPFRSATITMVWTEGADGDVEIEFSGDDPEAQWVLMDYLERYAAGEPTG